MHNTLCPDKKKFASLFKKKFVKINIIDIYLPIFNSCFVDKIKNSGKNKAYKKS